MRLRTAKKSSTGSKRRWRSPNVPRPMISAARSCDASSALPPKIDALAQAELAARMHQRLPFQWRSGELFGQQDLDLAAQKISCGRVFLRQPLRARAAAMPIQPRRQYLGIVEDQQIVGPQQVGEVAKLSVLPVRRACDPRAAGVKRRDPPAAAGQSTLAEGDSRSRKPAHSHFPPSEGNW